jgi:hypothetical protein
LLLHGTTLLLRGTVGHTVQVSLSQWPSRVRNGKVLLFQ